MGMGCARGRASIAAAILHVACSTPPSPALPTQRGSNSTSECPVDVSARSSATLIWLNVTSRTPSVWAPSEAQAEGGNVLGSLGEVGYPSFIVQPADGSTEVTVRVAIHCGDRRKMLRITVPVARGTSSEQPVFARMRWSSQRIRAMRRPGHPSAVACGRAVVRPVIDGGASPFRARWKDTLSNFESILPFLAHPRASAKKRSWPHVRVSWPTAAVSANEAFAMCTEYVTLAAIWFVTLSNA